MIIEEVKRCKGKCKQVKPLSDFNNKKAYRDGKNTQCRGCVREARLDRKNIKRVVAPARLKPNCMEGWWL